MRLMIALPLLLAACATPQAQCLREATADLRALQAERAERQRNLDRGFALPPAGRFPRACPEAMVVGISPCDDDLFLTAPIPINPRLEARRIALLDQLIAEEEARARSALASCPA